MMHLTRTELAKIIDYTLLKADASQQDIVELCREAKEYRFWAVCINSLWVSLASQFLASTEVRVCSVVSFPLGATTTDVKVAEAKQAISRGARELDMVVNIGALKSRDFETVRRDIASVVKVARSVAGIIVKVVLETGLLSFEEKVAGCKLANEAGADFVKTCTGFGAGMAAASDVTLLRKSVPDTMGVKASGGIHTYGEAIRMIHAGANRLGTSAGVAIILGEPKEVSL